MNILKFLTFEGAKKHYSEINQDLNDRILFELNVIKNSGIPRIFFDCSRFN